MGGYGRPLPMASRAGQQQAASERKSGRAISLSDRVRNGKGSEVRETTLTSSLVWKEAWMSSSPRRSTDGGSPS